VTGVAEAGGAFVAGVVGGRAAHALVADAGGEDRRTVSETIPEVASLALGVAVALPLRRTSVG
jgi:hypothetical protein